MDQGASCSFAVIAPQSCDFRTSRSARSPAITRHLQSHPVPHHHLRYHKCIIRRLSAKRIMLQIRWPSLPDFSSWASSASGIKLPKVKAHEIENQPEKRARTLKHLLKANHINHSIIYNDLRFHNHLPHILGSSYILGADSDELNHISEAESKHLEPWTDSPGEIARHDWRDFLGKREYAHA